MKGRSDCLLVEKRMGCLVDDRAKGNRREALGATARKVRFSQGSSIMDQTFQRGRQQCGALFYIFDSESSIMVGFKKFVSISIFYCPGLGSASGILCSRSLPRHLVSLARLSS